MYFIPPNVVAADGLDKFRLPEIFRSPPEDKVLRAEKNWMSPEETDCIVKTPTPAVVIARLEFFDVAEIIGFIPERITSPSIVVFPRLSTVNLAIPLDDALMSGPISF